MTTFTSPARIQVRPLENTIQVLVIHRSQDVARGLALLLGGERDLQVSAVASNIQHGAHWARIKQPDVVVIDANLPHISPEWSVDHIREGAPAAQFVFIGAVKPSPLSFRPSPAFPDVESVGPNEPVNVLLRAVRRARFRGPVRQRMPAWPAA